MAGTVSIDSLVQVLGAFGIVIGIILSICVAIVSVAKAWDVLCGLKKPTEDIKTRVGCTEKRLDGIDLRLGDGNERFERQDKVNDALKEGQRVACVGLQALLTSALYGNHSDGLTSAAKELTTYLTSK